MTSCPVCAFADILDRDIVQLAPCGCQLCSDCVLKMYAKSGRKDPKCSHCNDAITGHTTYRSRAESTTTLRSGRATVSRIAGNDEPAIQVKKKRRNPPTRLQQFKKEVIQKELALPPSGVVITEQTFFQRRVEGNVSEYYTQQRGFCVVPVNALEKDHEIGDIPGHINQDGLAECFLNWHNYLATPIGVKSSATADDMTLDELVTSIQHNNRPLTRCLHALATGSPSYSAFRAKIKENADFNSATLAVLMAGDIIMRAINPTHVGDATRTMSVIYRHGSPSVAAAALSKFRVTVHPSARKANNPKKATIIKDIHYNKRL